MIDPQESVRELFGDSPLNPESGKLLHNQYKILEKLGQGGMGAVYKADDTINKRTVAIKRICLKSGNPATPAIMQRFRREYYFLRKLQHPNLVKAYDFFEELDTLFLVMEFVDGISLHRLIRDRPHILNLQQQLDLSRQICLAVSVLNEAQILHRDIKPQNIIVSEDYKKIKLVDLGISKSLSQEESSLTEHGFVLGTPSYLSPEQVQGKISDRSDIFSLGLTLYQFFLWLPHSPFHTENKLIVMKNIVEMTLPPLIRRIPNDVPKLEHTVYRNLSEILQQALAKNPQRRLAYSRELADELFLLLELLIGKHVSSQDAEPYPGIAKAVSTIFDAEPEDSNGKKIKDFVLYRSVWENDVFQMYTGWDLERKCGVLVKKVSASIPNSSQRNFLQEQLMIEYYTMMGLNHPNIIKPLDLLEIEHEIFLIFQSFRGITLKDIIRQFPNTIELPKQLLLMLQLSQTVEYLNRQGIVIGNLQPDHILISPTHHQIALFNLIQTVEIQKSCTFSLKMGVTPYLSPEQIHGKVSSASDIFSLGVILYQFLIWQENSPFIAPSKEEIAGNICRQTLSMSLLIDKLPQEDIQKYSEVYPKFQAIIEQSSQKLPQQRLSVQEFVEKLQIISKIFIGDTFPAHEESKVFAKNVRKLKETQKISLLDGIREPAFTEDQLKTIKLPPNTSTPDSSAKTLVPTKPSTSNEQNETSESILDLEEKELPQESVPEKTDKQEKDVPIIRKGTRLFWNPEMFRYKRWLLIGKFLYILFWTGCFVWIYSYLLENFLFGKEVYEFLGSVVEQSEYYCYFTCIFFIVAICLVWRQRSFILGFIGGLEAINFALLLVLLPSNSLSKRLKKANFSSLLWNKEWKWMKMIVGIYVAFYLFDSKIYFNSYAMPRLLIALGIISTYFQYFSLGLTSFFANLLTPLISCWFLPLRIPALILLAFAGADLKLRYALQDLEVNLKHSFATLRWLTIWAIARILFADVIAQQKDSTRIRRWSRGRQALVEYVLQSLSDPVWYVRLQAVQALENVANAEKDVDSFIQFRLKDSNWMVRGATAVVLNKRIQLKNYLNTLQT